MDDGATCAVVVGHIPIAGHGVPQRRGGQRRGLGRLAGARRLEPGPGGVLALWLGALAAQLMQRGFAAGLGLLRQKLAVLLGIGPALAGAQLVALALDGGAQGHFSLYADHAGGGPLGLLLCWLPLGGVDGAALLVVFGLDGGAALALAGLLCAQCLFPALGLLGGPRCAVLLPQLGAGRAGAAGHFLASLGGIGLFQDLRGVLPRQAHFSGQKVADVQVSGAALDAVAAVLALAHGVFLGLHAVCLAQAVQQPASVQPLLDLGELGIGAAGLGALLAQLGGVLVDHAGGVAPSWGWLLGGALFSGRRPLISCTPSNKGSNNSRNSSSIEVSAGFVSVSNSTAS